MNLEVGTVFRWDNFPSPRHGEVKPRWFICLGVTGPFAQVASVYLSTTTTQTEQFEEYGPRSGHDHFLFRQEEIGIFEEDCIIDFHEQPYYTEMARIVACGEDIEEKGKLNEQKMRMIYNRYLVSPCTSQVQMMDIHNSYNQCGIEGLKKPKK